MRLGHPWRRALTGITLSCAMLALPISALAAWPDKPIRLVLAYPPGGGTDIVARLLAKYLTQHLGVGVVVENRGGAGGRIGTEFVAQSAPDGNTLLFAAGAEITMAPATVAKMPYDPEKDFEAISQIAGGPYILIASKDFAPNTLKQLVDFTKAHPKEVSYSTGGVYSSSDLMNLEFNTEVGISPIGVPYRGSGPSLVGLLSGEVQYTFNTPSATLNLIQSGKVKPIVVASAHRLSAFPDLPTISESGYPGFVRGSWYGLLAPRGTPSPILDRLHDEVVDFLKDADTRKFLASVYIEPIGSSRTEFRDHISSEIQRYKNLMSGLHLAPE